MNIQIFSKFKCFVSKNAERFFKERSVKDKFINILEKALSPRDLDFFAAVNDIDGLIDQKSPRYEKYGFACIW